MQITQFAVIASVVSLGASHALPIWDMLPRQEKIGQIMYLFAHLVDQNCAYSYVPDCHHLFMLRGLSNLVNMSEHTLNKLDPQQRGAQRVIWGAVMRDTWLPPSPAPHHLPYYLVPQVDEMSNEIEHSFPNPPKPPPHSSDPLYPYAALPNTFNTPEKAVNSPHPHAVKVPPPPGFEQKTEVRDSEVPPVDRFASWSDSEAIVGKPEEMVREFEAWSGNSDVIVGNQEPVEDIYASWSDAEVTVSDQRTPEDRFAGWNDAGMIENTPGTPEDRFAGWSDAGMTEEREKGSWDDATVSERFQDIPADPYASWSDSGVPEEHEEAPKDSHTSWSDAQTHKQEMEGDRITASEQDTHASQTESDRQTDRYASWSDSEAGMDGEDVKENRKPVGIVPSASFEPLMVESRVVVSQVAPPASLRAVLSTEKRKRSIPDSLPLPLPLLRQ